MSRPGPGPGPELDSPAKITVASVRSEVKSKSDLDQGLSPWKWT